MPESNSNAFIRNYKCYRILVSTQAYPQLSHAMAMKIGGERDPARIRVSHWSKFAVEAGLGASAAVRRLRSFAERTLQAVDQVAVSFGKGTNAPEIARTNCERMLHRLAGSQKNF